MVLGGHEGDYHYKHPLTKVEYMYVGVNDSDYTKSTYEVRDFPHVGYFIGKNLIPVTLGNFLGGALLAFTLWYIYLTPRAQSLEK